MAKTRECIYSPHIVSGEDADTMGECVDDGFMCNFHLHLHKEGVDPDDWTEGEGENQGIKREGVKQAAEKKSLALRLACPPMKGANEAS
jgi:hypothetical protein